MTEIQQDTATQNKSPEKLSLLTSIFFEVFFVAILLSVSFGILNYFNIVPLSRQITFLSFLPHKPQQIAVSTVNQPKASPSPIRTINSKLREEAKILIASTTAETVPQTVDKVYKDTDAMISLHILRLGKLLTDIKNDPHMTNTQYASLMDPYVSSMNDAATNLQQLLLRQHATTIPEAILDKQQIQNKLQTYSTFETKEIINLGFLHYYIQLSGEIVVFTLMESLTDSASYKGKDLSSIKATLSKTKQALIDAHDHFNTYGSHFSDLQLVKPIPNDKLTIFATDFTSYVPQLEKDLTTIQTDLDTVAKQFKTLQ